MKTKEIKIEAPKGYEIDKENSTFEKIVFKKVNCVFTLGDLVKNGKKQKFHYCRAGECAITSFDALPTISHCSHYPSEDLAKSAVALAYICNLLPYYSEPFTDEELCNDRISKWGIYYCAVTKIFQKYQWFSSRRNIFSFRDGAQADLFIEKNKELLNQYFIVK